MSCDRLKERWHPRFYDGCHRGVYLQETTEALMDAIREFELRKFDSLLLRRHAQQFSEERFLACFEEILCSALESAGVVPVGANFVAAV